MRSKKTFGKCKTNSNDYTRRVIFRTCWKKSKKLYKPKSLKQIAQNNIRLDDKQLNKYLAGNMLNPYYFTNRALKMGFEINLDSHHINHANSKLTILPNYSGFGIETIYINKILKEMATIYARLTNQYKFRYQTVFSARFDKQDEDDQVLDDTELFIILIINDNLTQIDIDNIDVKSPLEYQIQLQEMKDSGLRLDKINSRTIYFYKTGEINCPNYV